VEEQLSVTKSLTTKRYRIGYVAKNTKKKLLCSNIIKQASELKYLIYVVTDKGSDCEIKLKSQCC
jgi:hypothetical protein